MPSPALLIVLSLAACEGKKPADPSHDPDTAAPADSGSKTDSATDSGTRGEEPDPFADLVLELNPGEGAGHGQDALPDVVLGPPQGGGEQGSVHVLSLGREGSIVLGFDDIGLIDGEGPDLIVFENPFPGWVEPGYVAVSEDLETWHEWPCDPADAEGGHPGCAGTGLVWAHPDNDIDPTDPDTAGGNAFDLADLGLQQARYVRIRDAGTSNYDGVAGGFDLDAIAIANGEPITP